jgi:hypothetical protein
MTNEFMRLMELKPVRPLAPAMVKKGYEASRKRSKRTRTCSTSPSAPATTTACWARLCSNGSTGPTATATCAWASARAPDRGRGLGAQALGLLLRFAFAELNLFRVTIVVPEYCQAAIALVNKFGFVEEVRRRKAILRDGRAWDLLASSAAPHGVGQQT